MLLDYATSEVSQNGDKKEHFWNMDTFYSYKSSIKCSTCVANIKKEIDDREHKTEGNREKQVTVYGNMFIILKMHYTPKFKIALPFHSSYIRLDVSGVEVGLRSYIFAGRREKISHDIYYISNKYYRKWIAIKF